MSRREGGGPKSGGVQEEPGTLADGLRLLAPLDHAALLFEDDDEAAEVAGMFLRLGLAPCSPGGPRTPCATATRRSA